MENRKHFTCPPEEIHIKIGAQVMIQSNIDVTDGLVNGVIGRVVYIQETKNNELPRLIGLMFHDSPIGKNAKQKQLRPPEVSRSFNNTTLNNISTSTTTNPKTAISY